MTFEAMWRDLLPVGRSATSGGYHRQPWTSAESELRAWFDEAARSRGLEVETDGIGNQVAWWRPAESSAVEEVAQVAQRSAVEEVAQRPSRNPAVLTGSHLDSVLDGGAFDGPLGVVSALAAIDVLRDRGFEPARPLGVSVFTEEEGSRFGLACLGSRLVTGAASWDDVRDRQDRDGVRLADAVEGAGLDPTAGLLSLADVGCFVELHVEQGRDLVDRDVEVGVASQIWPHGRFRFDFVGEANHAGTTRMEDRHDPMLTYAMTVLAANKQARLADQRATFGRLEVAPNGTNAVPSRVTAWLDARCSSDDALAELVETISRQGHERASRDGTSLSVTAESVSSAVSFDADLARDLAAVGDWPIIATQAGHDAGILSAAGIPTAMLFVRNPTGVSHSPAELAETADCLAGVEALADVLAELGVVTAHHLERALLPDGVHADVLVEVVDGRFTAVERGVLASAAERVPGLTIPGLANTHSHAFHRALRGRTQRGRGTFWTWREQMYALAERLDPDTYLALATATFREMVAAGITCVGEFHYLHHQPDGRPYDDPNAMGLAVVEAARVAGIRITLLDTLYLSSGFGAQPEGAQVRYDDGSVHDWTTRVDAVRVGEHALVAGALHSVRALPTEPATTLGALAGWSEGRPLHVHLSEQVAENEGCLSAYGVSPARLLADHGLLGPLTTLVHATHLSDEDVAIIGGAGASVSFCPTTERDLGDGVGPGRRLVEAGARLTLGSDSHAVIDLFEEMRAVELDERLVSQQRGHWTAADLVRAATTDGHASLGWDDAGAIAVGQRADLVTLDDSSPRTAGTGSDEHTVVFAAVAEDVTQTMVDGRVVFRRGDREEIGRALAGAVEKVLA